MFYCLLRWLFTDELGDLHPPDWMHHIISWRRLQKWSDRYPLCWSGMVSWKIGDSSSWNPTSTCWSGRPSYDYCHKYKTHGEFRAARDEWPEVEIFIKEE